MKREGWRVRKPRHEGYKCHGCGQNIKQADAYFTCEKNRTCWCKVCVSLAEGKELVK